MPDNVITTEPQEYVTRTGTIVDLAAALCKAQGQIANAAKDSTNPHFGNKYADLASVWDAIRAPLSENGLSVIQFPRTVQGGVEIETTLLHASGQFMRDTLWMPCSKNDAQGIGSAITYGRRYALMAIVGVAPAEDDDGNGAVKTSPKDATPPPPPAQRGSSANGRRMAADEPDLIDNTRTKGTLPASQKAAPTDKVAAAKKNAADWVTDQVIKMNESELTIDQLRQIEEDNRVKLDWMQGNMPEQFDKFYGAFSNALERATKREAA